MVYCSGTYHFSYMRIILLSKAPGKLGKIIFLTKLACAESPQVWVHEAYLPSNTQVSCQRSGTSALLCGQAEAA